MVYVSLITVTGILSDNTVKRSVREFEVEIPLSMI